MPRKKDRHHSKIKHNENTNQQLNQSLFSEIDAKSVEVSGYTLGHGAPQVDEFMKEHTLPTGVGKFSIILLKYLSIFLHIHH